MCLPWKAVRHHGCHFVSHREQQSLMQHSVVSAVAVACRITWSMVQGFAKEGRQMVMLLCTAAQCSECSAPST